MMSTCVAMNSGEAMPPYIMADTGSGLVSTIMTALAVYIFGMRIVTPTVAATVTISTSSAIHQRARKMATIWARFMLRSVHRPCQNKLSRT